MTIMDILMYFALTAFATAAGLLYSMCLENMQRKGFKTIWAFLLSLLVTPFGAYLASLVLRESPPPEPEVPPVP